ncbi:DNA topoisomerase 2-like [Planococcus citri]|uniref:DNA topoisomerase 2-like n=1 Tax=Planococcus citri TaxID=170843 RepID=UPI0031F96CB8
MLATSTPMQNGNSVAGGGDAPAANKKPKGLIEKMYQKKSQLEHILLRPDTYIGSVELLDEQMWVFDKETKTMKFRNIKFVPGLYKIFDEILVNAADNKQRDSKMDCIKITIDQEANEISIWNNGKGIPVVEHKDEKMYVPTMIFGHLLTSSNYDDDEKKVTGGRNGYGAKLCNIFSTKFIVETACKEYKRKFKQTWTNNMSKTTTPSIKDSSDDYTKITFSPDLSKFHMDKLDDDIVALMSRRAYDVAASSRGVKVFLNGERLPVKAFKDYVELYVHNPDNEGGDDDVRIYYDNSHPRWEVAVTLSEKGFQQMSFVNSIATTKGGRHVDFIADQITKKMLEAIGKGKNKTQIKPFQVKNHLWLFVNCLIENPTFDSQTKENMTLQSSKFGSKFQLPDKFHAQLSKSKIREAIETWAKFKQDVALAKTSGKKQSKLKGVPKLEDANEAGTKNSRQCTLILTEGDSAKSLAVSGLGVIGRDYYGVFPLRGKLLNVREASHKQIMDNAEINHIVKIVGLQYRKKYETEDDMKTLRYGKLMIMTDQDQDGSHIKGLIINFIHHNWPSLLKMNFLEEFITPIIKATRKTGRNDEEVLSFFSIPEFDEWKNNTPNWNRFTIKYYKGLGTSTSEEAKEYFSNMSRHRIKFLYKDNDDDSHITMAFSKKMVDARKDWLTNWMGEMKRRKELGLGEEYLYGKDTKAVTYKDFINKELVLFSNMDNERSIPCALDGLKPGSRKVLFTCLKRNLTKELKVAQLAGSVAELSAYHHGEQSLMSTIINLAQNYVGSNNINLLQPLGQFGTRLQGGKDAASPRYIFTKLSPLTRLIFHPNDDPLMNYLRDDNQKIEPEWYMPIIPMVLVNGAEGIGTGWMTKIANYNPREIIDNLQRMIRGDEPVPMKPWYKNFLGEIEKLGETRFVTSGEVGILSDEKIEITELPVGTWTQTYKENVLEPLLNPESKAGEKGDKGSKAEKAQPFITNYKEYNTDKTVKFQVFLTKEKLKKAELDGLHKIFKLQNTMTTTSMCAFDRYGVLRRYDSATQILREFFEVRLEFYVKRKSYLEGMLEAEAAKLTNQARFILEKCDGDLRIENRKKKEMIAELVRRGYPGDPVRTWKIRVDREAALEEEVPPPTEGEETADEDAPEEDPNKDFDYLLGMKLWSLTLEKKNEMLKKRDEKQTELDLLKKKTPSDLWVNDLDALLAKMDEVEELEREIAASGKPAKGMKGPKDKKKAKVIAAADSLPSPHAIRIKPRVDAELLKKYEKADQVKDKVKKPKKGKDDVEGSEEKSEKSEKSSASKVKSEPKSEPGATKAKRPKKEPKEKSPKKKSKKGSDSEDDMSSGSESDDDFRTSATTPDTPKRATARRAAAPKKYTFDSENEEDFSDHDDNEDLVVNNAVVDDYAPAVVDDESDSSFTAEPEKKKDDSDVDDSPIKKKPAAKKPAASRISDFSDEDSPPKKKPAPKKPAAKKPKYAASDSEDGDLFDEPSAPESEDDSDFDIGSKKKKTKKETAKAAPKKKAAAAPKQPKEPKKLAVTKSKPAAKKKPAADHSSDEEIKDILKRKKSHSSDSDDDFLKNQPQEDANLTTDDKFDMLLAGPSKKAAPAEKKKNEYSFEPSIQSYDSDDDYQPETKKKAAAKAPPKKRQTKKAKYVESSDGSDF